MWDVFICHASEDKEKLVRPLAQELKKYDIKVWYDEFELQVGDSLSKSIDIGLRQSSFGIVVLSKDFFRKNWTDYEYRSLITRQIESKTILPIWHEVTVDDIKEYSLFLSDLFAISSEIGIEEIANKIVCAINPEVMNSIAIIEALKRFEEKRLPIKIKTANMTCSNKIWHNELPNHILIASKLICDIVGELAGTYEEFILCLKQDVDYEKEFIIWNVIACTYIEYINNGEEGTYKDKNMIISFLLGLTIEMDRDPNKVLKISVLMSKKN